MLLAMHCAPVLAEKSTGVLSVSTVDTVSDENTRCVANIQNHAVKVALNLPYPHGAKFSETEAKRITASCKIKNKK